MCLIIHREQGSNVPNEVLEYNRKKNPDGFGLAWRDADGLHHQKYSPGNYDAFHEMLKRLDGNPDIEYTAHFRFATHGPACERLSHPFPYKDMDGEDILVFHNGIIPIAAPKEESDTSQFVNAVLARLPSGWWNDGAMRFLVESAVGYSRLLIMTATETVRLNESSWVRRGGIMYSTEPGPSRSTYTPVLSSVVKYTPPKAKHADKHGKKGKHSRWRREEPRSTDNGNFGYDDPDDDVQGWSHMGHWVESLDTERLDGDTGDVACAVICVDCQNTGEVYIIGGTTFIDVSHGIDLDDEEDIDALTMAHVYAN